MNLRDAWNNMREQRQQDRHTRDTWRSAESMSDLGERNIQWLNGEVQQTPAHMGPPERESERVKEDLVDLNRRGFVTYGSEPGWAEYGQHAQVFGNTSRQAAADISRAAERDGLEYKGYHVGSLRPGWDWRRNKDAPTRGDHHLKWGRFTGAGAWNELQDSVDVQVRDPEMGRERTLWESVRCALPAGQENSEAGR